MAMQNGLPAAPSLPVPAQGFRHVPLQGQSVGENTTIAKGAEGHGTLTENSGSFPLRIK
jgi:hypothetical protein